MLIFSHQNLEAAFAARQKEYQGREVEVRGLKERLSALLQSRNELDNLKGMLKALKQEEEKERVKEEEEEERTENQGEEEDEGDDGMQFEAEGRKQVVLLECREKEARIQKENEREAEKEKMREKDREKEKELAKERAREMERELEKKKEKEIYDRFQETKRLEKEIEARIREEYASKNLGGNYMPDSARNDALPNSSPILSPFL